MSVALLLNIGFSAAWAQVTDGTVYAGQSGASGFNGDGGPATMAELYSPQGIAFDSKGNLYIADLLNNRIRVVAGGSGTITTFAGSGQAGNPANEDGKPATGVPVDAPISVTVDGSDNVYILTAEYQIAGVQKVSASTGLISTVVPSSVLANFLGAFPSAPQGIGMAVDKAASYVWLALSGQVLKIAVASGSVTTFPTGSPLINTALALAPNGDLFFLAVLPGSNPPLPSIVRVNAVTGAMSTVYSGPLPASGSTAVLFNPSALCVDPSGNIFFANQPANQYVANAIFRIDAKSGAVSEIAATSLLSGIEGNSLAADSAGNLYYSEIDSTVRRVAAGTGAASGTGSAPAITPGGVVPVGSTVPIVQPGEWVAIYGNNLASTTATWNGNFQTTLGGTSVTIDGKPGYLSFVGPGQINLQVPDDSTTGAVPVVVTTGSGSASSTVTLAAIAPAFLLLDAKHVAGIILRTNGSGAYGEGTYDILGPTGTSLGYQTVAAKAGDVVMLFGTGFGPTTPHVAAGLAFSGSAPTTNAVQISINGISVTPFFSGLSGAGLVQLNFTVPAGLGAGDVPLLASVGGAKTPSNVVISLQ